LVATSVIPVLPSGCGRPARSPPGPPLSSSPRSEICRARVNPQNSPAPSSVWMPERLESELQANAGGRPVLHRGSRTEHRPRPPGGAPVSRRSATRAGRSAVNRVQRRRRRASEFVTGHFRKVVYLLTRPAHPPHFLHRALTVCELLTMSCPQCTREIDVGLRQGKRGWQVERGSFWSFRAAPSKLTTTSRTRARTRLDTGIGLRQSLFKRPPHPATAPGGFERSGWRAAARCS